MDFLNYQQNNQDFEIVGLVPAGGLATRISPLPCSKEIYPIGFRSVGDKNALRAKVVCHYLLEKMRHSGATKAYIILRDGKWDIPAYFSDGTIVNINLAYLMMNLPYGAPYTLDQAYPFVRNARIVFGFPDILFQPDDAFLQLLTRQAETNADVALGLFPTDQPHKMDMVDLDDAGKIRQIMIKPQHSQLRYTWIIAVWGPVFTQFMHDYLSVQLKKTEIANGTPEQNELYVGNVVWAAIQAGLQVDTVTFDDGHYIDIGTPKDLAHAIALFSRLSLSRPEVR